MTAYALALSTVALIGLVIATGLAVSIIRDPGDPDPPPERVWGRVELAGLRDPAAWRPACGICGGRHCAGCAEPARTMAAPHRHISLHSEEEIPPSILVPALLMDVVPRARELTRQLGNATWRPHRPYRTVTA